MGFNKIKRVLDKHIVNRYTFVGSPNNSDLDYLKKTYGDPLFVDINSVKDESFGSVFCINPVVISVDESDANRLIDLFNKIGPKKHRYIMKVPKTFEFSKFVKSVKPDQIDVYNNHESHYVIVSKL